MTNLPLEACLQNSRRITANIHVIMAILYGLGAAFFAYGLLVSIFQLNETFNWLILLGCFSFSVLHLVASKALVQQRTWARPVSILLALVMLIWLPLGTFLGSVVLYQMCRHEWSLVDKPVGDSAQ